MEDNTYWANVIARNIRDAIQDLLDGMKLPDGSLAIEWTGEAFLDALEEQTRATLLDAKEEED